MGFFDSKRLSFGLVCMFFFLTGALPAGAQLLPYPSHNIPFNGLPPQDSASITRINIDPLFIPHFNVERVSKVPALRSGDLFLPASLDTHFYLLCGILFFVGVVFRTSPRYFNNLFGLLFRSGFRQKSIRDQLVQNKLTSLGLNLLFFLAGGMFIYLFVRGKGVLTLSPWYVDVGLCFSFLVVIYVLKFFCIKAGGWIFSSRELAGQYVFIIFFVNKIAGLFLLPIIMVLWLGNPLLYPFFSTLSLLMLGLLVLYRYYMILPLVRTKSGISAFHFFLYLCAFEILPIVLLVKFLLDYLNSTN